LHTNRNFSLIYLNTTLSPDFGSHWHQAAEAPRTAAFIHGYAQAAKEAPMTKVAVAALAYVVTTITHSRRPLTLHACHVMIAHVTDYYVDVVHAWWWRCIVLLTWLPRKTEK